MRPWSIAPQFSQKSKKKDSLCFLLRYTIRSQVIGLERRGTLPRGLVRLLAVILLVRIYMNL
jgi:hypothetical protein